MVLADYFWRIGDWYGLIVLVLGLAATGIVFTGLSILVMFGMSKIKPLQEKLEETSYGGFEFENFQMETFQNFALRVAVIYAGTLLVLHLMEYLIVYREVIRHRAIWTLVLFVMETAGIALGLFFVFKLDRVRLAIITAATAVIYLILLTILRSSMQEIAAI